MNQSSLVRCFLRLFLGRKVKKLGSHKLYYDVGYHLSSRFSDDRWLNSPKFGECEARISRMIETTNFIIKDKS